MFATEPFFIVIVAVIMVLVVRPDDIISAGATGERRSSSTPPSRTCTCPRPSSRSGDAPQHARQSSAMRCARRTPLSVSLRHDRYCWVWVAFFQESWRITGMTVAGRRHPRGVGRQRQGRQHAAAPLRRQRALECQVQPYRIARALPRLVGERPEERRAGRQERDRKVHHLGGRAPGAIHRLHAR